MNLQWTLKFLKRSLPPFYNLWYIAGSLRTTHVFIRRLYANGDVCLGLNLKAPAGSFTSNCLKNISLQDANLALWPMVSRFAHFPDDVFRNGCANQNRSISLYFPDCLFGEDRRWQQSGTRLISTKISTINFHKQTNKQTFFKV